ncbi:MAG TPA: sialate O-acetylesterase [Isosphaeraceae bacterium]|nr:sialate O-acetylesterase [Isosphaeraceae bacterium]
MLSIALLALLAPAFAVAQQLGGVEAELKEPTDQQVYQRDERGRAPIPVRLEAKKGEAKIRDAHVLVKKGSDPNTPPSFEVEGVEFADGVLKNVPTGGPYEVRVMTEGGQEYAADDVFVGDLWVLAGQSNMEGYGDLTDVAPPHEKVMALGMDGEWRRAEEPLHWLVDSPDPIHSGDPSDREQRSKQQHKNRRKGAGLGLPFATAMVEATGVPVGLIPCAHGGTSMEQWSPSKKDEGGKSLYGSMIRQIKLAGGKVKGVLWYQGESDANEKAAKEYPKAFADFIRAVRRDLDEPALPFYYVQIGRVVGPMFDAKHWNAIQEAQRTLPDRVANTAVVAAVDLELDDLIHVGVQGHKRLGKRLAGVALRELFSHGDGRSAPNLDRVTRVGNHTLHVKFKGINESKQGDGTVFGLWRGDHHTGFSIRKADGTLVPLVYEATTAHGPPDTVTLKLNGDIPPGSFLWYGYGLDPAAVLTDQHDMAIPVFGPIALDDIGS